METWMSLSWRLRTKKLRQAVRYMQKLTHPSLRNLILAHRKFSRTYLNHLSKSSAIFFFLSPSFSLQDAFSACLIISPASKILTHADVFLSPPSDSSLTRLYVCVAQVCPQVAKCHHNGAACTSTHTVQFPICLNMNMTSRLIYTFIWLVCFHVLQYSFTQSALERGAVKRQQENMIHAEDRNT